MVGLARSGVPRPRALRRGRAPGSRSPTARPAAELARGAGRRWRGSPSALRAGRPRRARLHRAPTWWWSRRASRSRSPSIAAARARRASRCWARSSWPPASSATSRWWPSPAPTARAPPPRSPAASSRRTGAAFVGGNLGTPLSELVALRAAASTWWWSSSPPSSSRGSSGFRPRVGAILNVTPDHLDRYPGMDAYAAAKARLFENQQPGDFAVANERDPRALAAARSHPRASVVTFGFGPPARMAAARTTARWLRFDRRRRRRRSATGSATGPCAAATTWRTPWRRWLCARLLGVPGRGGAARARRLPRPAPPARAGARARRRRVDERLQGHQRRLDRASASPPSRPARPSVVLLLGGRGKKAPYAPLRAALPGARQGAAHPRRGRPGHRAGARRPRPHRVLRRPRRRRGARRRASPARATWCSSRRPARATISSGATRSAARPSAGSPRRCPLP